MGVGLYIYCQKSVGLLSPCRVGALEDLKLQDVAGLVDGHEAEGLLLKVELCEVGGDLKLLIVGVVIYGGLMHYLEIGLKE